MSNIRDPKIIKNLIIRERYHSGFKRTKPITTIVIHGTGGGGTLRWVEDADRTDLARAARYRKAIGLFHYLITQGLSGGPRRENTDTGPVSIVLEVIDPDRWVYHASVGQLDHGTIGIECLNPGRANSGHYTTAQIEELANLCAYLVRRYPTIKEFVGHGRMKQRLDRAGKAWKICPGPNFPWDFFQAALAERLGVRVKRDKNYESCWID